MAAFPVDEPADRGLQQLLEVEQRLQDLVRTAKEDAARTIAAAHAEGERRLVSARDTAMRADAERARTELAAHHEALSAIDAAHRAALTRITSLSDSQVDELARWALAQAISVTGDPT